MTYFKNQKSRSCSKESGERSTLSVGLDEVRLSTTSSGRLVSDKTRPSSVTTVPSLCEIMSATLMRKNIYRWSLTDWYEIRAFLPEKNQLTKSGHHFHSCKKICSGQNQLTRPVVPQSLHPVLHFLLRKIKINSIEGKQFTETQNQNGLTKRVGEDQVEWCDMISSITIIAWIHFSSTKLPNIKSKKISCEWTNHKHPNVAETQIQKGNRINLPFRSKSQNKKVSRTVRGGN